MGRKIPEQMGEPYKRIIIMHMTIIFGGFLTLMMNDALFALELMIVLKVGADLSSHLKEHGKATSDKAQRS